eukprot:SAG22_NODE_21767_length_254_cov_0.670968_1_plen_25_part_01
MRSAGSHPLGQTRNLTSVREGARAL